MKRFCKISDRDNRVHIVRKQLVRIYVRHIANNVKRNAYFNVDNKRAITLLNYAKFLAVTTAVNVLISAIIFLAVHCDHGIIQN